MDRFDLAEQRKHAMALYGVPLCLSTSVDECRQFKSMASSAWGVCLETVRSVIVGWVEPVQQLADKGIELASASIAENEHDESDFNRVCAFSALALLDWVKTNASQPKHSHDVGEALTKYYKAHEISPQSFNNTVDLLLAVEAHAALLNLYAASRMTPPKSPKTAKSPANVGYVIAKQATERCFNEDDLAKSIHAMLQAHVEPKWLCGGHLVRAANWMKVAYWSPGESAVTTIQRARDFLAKDEPATP
jgi:hypothetical protein